MNSICTLSHAPTITHLGINIKETSTQIKGNLHEDIYHNIILWLRKVERYFRWPPLGEEINTCNGYRIWSTILHLEIVYWMHIQQQNRSQTYSVEWKELKQSIIYKTIPFS